MNSVALIIPLYLQILNKTQLKMASIFTLALTKQCLKKVFPITNRV